MRTIELDMKSGNCKWHLSGIFQTIEPDSVFLREKKTSSHSGLQSCSEQKSAYTLPLLIRTLYFVLYEEGWDQFLDSVFYYFVGRGAGSIFGLCDLYFMKRGRFNLRTLRFVLYEEGQVQFPDSVLL